MNNKIAIIGGGVQGVLCCKYAVQNNFIPTIFEKKNRLLGIWAENSLAWPSLITNISKYFTNFQDFMFDDIIDNYPSKSQMTQFLTEYVETYKIEDNVKYNTEVIKIRRIKNKYEVEYICNDVVTKEIFDHVCICSGNNDIPNYIGLQTGKIKNIEVLHSKDYNTPEVFKNKNVLVVGNSFSGVEIAAEVCQSAKEVVNNYLNPAWVTSKYIYDPLFEKYMPYDLSLFTRKNLELRKISKDNKANVNKIKNMVLAERTGQNEIHKNLYINPLSEQKEDITISNTYLNYVKRGLIQPEIGTIETIDYENKKVTLSSKKEFNVDVIILCTGFIRNYSFLDEELLKEVSFNPNMPSFKKVNLKYQIFSPTSNSLAFIGIMRGSLSIWELQAKVAIEGFKGTLRENIDFEAEEEILIIDKYSEILNLQPNLDLIEKKDPELYEALINGPLVTQQYYIGDLSTQQNKYYADYIKKIYKDLSRKCLITKF